MTPADEAAIRDVIAGVDTAWDWFEVEIARLQRAIDAGVSLEVIGAVNRAIWRAKEEGHAAP